MQIGRVIGTATATVKHPTFQSERLLVVQLETAAGGPDGEPILTFDRLGVRRGDLVVVTNDGLRASGDHRPNHTRPVERARHTRRSRHSGRSDAMRIAQVIGRVTLSRSLPSLCGGRLLLAQPLPLDALTQKSAPCPKIWSFTTFWVRATGA